MLFKLHRGSVSECGMEASVIVVAFQKLLDMLAEFLQIPILMAVDFFVFQGFHEALTGGVVVRISLSFAVRRVLDR